MIHSEDWLAVLKEMKKARKKHPTFPDDIVKMAALVVEEAGEAMKEANNIDEGKGCYRKLKIELYQTIGVAFRQLSQMRGD
ncbi:MAG: hypothetical protein GY804_03020 [Alphaproteobacteria bacterium]|nr:hypothetical protein [Alphaproteobacteria bacterium]